MTSNLIVERLPDGQVRVARESWHDTFAEERRIPWADWYLKMYQDTGYPGYLETSEALRALEPIGG